MFTARTALRTSALRRSIHTGRASNTIRSSWNISGAVLVAGAVTYAAYHSWDTSSSSRRISLDENPPAPQRPRTQKETRKPEESSSVDAPAPAKPSSTKPGVLEPSDEAPTPTPVVGSDPPTDEEAQSEEDKDRAANQGAYNPETGEINWDCPCLGGMAHGPCGPQFREAFSCFVYSNEEPKGVDCVEKFKAMQDCFRAHPDVYGEEIDDEDEDEDMDMDKNEAAEGSEKPGVPTSQEEQKEKESQPPDKPRAAKNTKPDTPAGVPAPPSPAPPSRTNAPTANVSPGTTPTKRGGTH
ncbi:Oxidoreductase [Ceratobasidium sp. 428]|nr:Oxidoreductase [Ceratobasidium sp. 428]